MEKAFTVREDCELKNWMIGLTEDFHEKNPTFILHYSYAILAARLLGFTYPDYLRYCAVQGGSLRGATGFPHVVFKDKKDAEKICKLINTEWDKFYNTYWKYNQ